MITNVGTAVDFHEAVAAARGAVRAVNSRGGISGHEVKLIFCDEALDPNKARACARTMVSEHVIATAGNAIVTAETDVNKILGDGGVPNVGAVSFSGAAGTDPNSYLFWPGSSYGNAAMAKFAVQLGGSKKVAQLLLESPISSTFEPLVSGVVKSLGGEYVGTVTVPQVTSDTSTQAAALLGLSPNAVLTNASVPASLGVIKDMVGLGYAGKFVTGGSQFSESDLKQLGAAANQIVFATPFPPFSASQIPGIAEFLKDMEAERASGDKDTPSATQIVTAPIMSAWLGVIAIERIANPAKAVDAASFKKAINSATDVDLGGVIPAWTPNKAIPGSILPRASNGTFFFYTWNDGKATLVSDTPNDVTDLVTKFLPK